jgi:FAD/FMN-containing dehydrogenase
MHEGSPPLNAPTPELIRRLAAVVGVAHALTDPEAQRPYLVEWRDRYAGKSPVVLRPGSVGEVSQILAMCNEARVGVVPQAGNTGLVGGQIPFENGREVLLSVARIDKVRAVDDGGGWLVAEAGATLADVQDAAERAGRLFPLSMASEASCRIGGNLATNAGGTAVLAYGTARNLVLGLEVVLADGRVWDGLRTLKKDNTGYDLRDLFVGSEGTLGVITAAALKLLPRPAATAVAMAAVPGLDDVAALFRMAEKRTGPALTGFEFMSQRTVAFVERHAAHVHMPTLRPAPWWVLLEVSGSAADSGPSAMVEELLSEAIAEGIATDAVVAASATQAQRLWAVREAASEAQKGEGGSIKHDVSVPLARLKEFIRRADRAVEALCPGARPVPFGHFGDGNVHYNVSQPVGMDRDRFLALWEPMQEAVHAIVADLGGSISAEHGIGRMKRAENARRKPAVEIDMMRAIKRALDPAGILNPGKLV